MSGMGGYPKIGSRAWVIKSADDAYFRRKAKTNKKYGAKGKTTQSKSTFCPTVDHY